ncbi:MAG: hypothetical protein AABW56_05005 [Nanoarchaeota archaeon]
MKKKGDVKDIKKKISLKLDNNKPVKIKVKKQVKMIHKKHKTKPHENIPKNIPAERKVIIKTDFDILVNYVNAREVVKLSEVARMFKINIKKAEEWAKILESHNLLELHYPTFGEPELKKWKK